MKKEPDIDFHENGRQGGIGWTGNGVITTLIPKVAVFDPRKLLQLFVGPPIHV